MVVNAISQAHKKMSTAQILLWYPIVERQRVNRLIKNICDTGIRNIWQFELGLEEDARGYGMTGSGMLAINPPWVLADQMRELLPSLSKQLVTDSGYYTVERLVGE